MRRLSPSDIDPGNPSGNKEASLTRTFKVAVVLSVYHNKLMCGFDETRELMDFVCGRRVPIWYIPIAMKICRGILDKKYPWLKQNKVDPLGKPDTFPRFVRKVTAIHGSDTIDVPAAKAGQYKPRPALETMP